MAETKSQIVVADKTTDDKQQNKNNNNDNDESLFLSNTSNFTRVSEDDRSGSNSSFGVRETDKLRRFRRMFTFFLIIFAVGLATGIFLLTRSQEKAELADSFDDSTTRILDQVHNSIERKIGAIESLSFAITSYAKFKNQIWPYVTIPDFEYQAATARSLSQAISIELCPLVTDSNRAQWETYSQESRKKWIEAGLAFEELVRNNFFLLESNSGRRKLQDDESGGSTVEDFGVTNQITYFASDDIDDRVVVSEAEYYFPIWQSSPVNQDLVNLDLHSTKLFSSAIDMSVETEQVVIGTTVDGHESKDPVVRAIQDSFDSRNVENAYYGDGGPLGFLYIPVFNVLNETKRRPVALLIAALNWESYMFQALPPHTPEILVVLTNDCGDSFTYSIIGEYVEYVGKGDLHDPKYDPFKVDSITFEFDSLKESLERYHGIPINDSCQYHMEIFPTQEYEDKYVTHVPWVFFAMTVGIFLFLITMIYCYDRQVERNYQLVYRRAKQAGAIVSSIFPAAVRRRLYQDEVDSKNSREANNPERGTAIPSAINANKLKIKGFLSSKPAVEEPQLEKSVREEHSPSETCGPTDGAAVSNTNQAIADLFPEVTIMFAGIVGFEAWSSQRDPGEVFTLLQDLYHEFDSIARAMAVFKVETIGDSYVAAAGLPEPQRDHAVRMTRFACKCMMAIVDVTRGLEVKLGPDTGELKLRIGLHSGPVTAGVLKGAKARFQLFGDTMNTAARMEQNSLPGAIQCSEATAELLRKAGKDFWLESRDEKVVLKGKGEVQAFWLTPKSGTPTVASNDDVVGDLVPPGIQSSGNGSTEAAQTATEQLWFDLGTPNNRFHRLIDWNVALLSDLLKQIAAHRADKKQKSKAWQNATVQVPQMRLKGGSSAVDEISEIVALPQSEIKTKQKTRASDVELGPEVMVQLRDYVTTIASMYRSNAFHNFEHASHVTMSTIKLLKRVTAKGGVEEDDDEEHDANMVDLHDYTFGITSDPLTQFTLVFCALIHDVDHAGVSNYQLIKEKATIATMYRNRSIAEQNSVDLSWDLLMDPNYKDLQRAIYADEDELKRFRQLVVNIVLATDIFDKDMKSVRDRRWGRAFQYANEEEEEEKREDLPMKALERNYETPLSKVEGANLRATIVMEHLIQASDVAHTMQHWEIYLKWNERLFNEMYSAYKRGRAVKDPSCTWYEGEIMFFDKYVIPLAKKLAECRVFGVSSDECLNYATQNRKQWAIDGDKIVHGFLERYEERTKASPPAPTFDQIPLELKL